MRLTKIHRVLSFQQKPWMKTYIEGNNTMRASASSDFEKEFFKLMNNSVFGKTMENVRNHVNVRLVTNARQMEKLVAKVTFKRRTIFSENFAAVLMRKTKVLFDKPLYVGATVLDVSKTLIYDFHYNVMKKRYARDNIQLLYTDTDSLIYHITTPNWYADVKDMIQHFDTSDYDKDNVYGLPLVNKKVLGKMKDELNGRIMTKFVGLRSKMYAIAYLTDKAELEEKKRAKGVQLRVVRKELTLDDYDKCLDSTVEVYKRQTNIRSFKHELYSVSFMKKALSSRDDKRDILNNGIDTLAWGHCKRRQHHHHHHHHHKNL